ncbi:hypothetical protein [Fodinicola feengrottensis]|uniref:hypothetical protein n=1 Tax=Fodinicola feengrottensis TaxID=435914 RepID=UPI0024421B59|nr:hypothetical protein [Fodinicola feengrottensis]
MAAVTALGWHERTSAQPAVVAAEPVRASRLPPVEQAKRAVCGINRRPVCRLYLR